MISVIVTVGPNPAYKKYLGECIDSIHLQEEGLGKLDIVLVDDAAHLDPTRVGFLWTSNYYKNLWNLGQAASQNIGVVLAKYDWVFMMGGCDDVLKPGCIEACWKQAEKSNFSKRTYFNPIIETSEGDTSNLAQGVGLFHRDLWYWLGGMPREAGIGEVDAIMTSLMLKKGVIMQPCGDIPLYWHREHSQALTHTKSYARHEAAGIIRGMITNEWEDPSYWVRGYLKDNGDITA